MISAIIQFILGLPALLKAAFSVWGLIADYFKKRSEEKRARQVQEGIDEIKKAKSKEESASAACKIEKALNPDANCDTNYHA